MRVRQVELEDANHHYVLVWVDARLPLKPGMIVTGQKDKKCSRVIHVYTQTIERDALHTDWTVGGLT